jgi:hypothetical protein
MRLASIFFAVLVASPLASAQFRDDFSGGSLTLDPRGVNGWMFYTGDGSAVMRFFQPEKRYASITVDGSKDTMGIWWALIRRRVSGSMNLQILKNPKYAVRVEARIRVSDAPKRVNLHLNTQRTTDFHTHLMEFDIPDTSTWHTISMTTHGFDAVPGDTIYGQLALMDWGLGNYRVDLDYYRVDIVEVDSAGADQGVQVPYRPPIPETSAFRCHLPVIQDGIVDKEYGDKNFDDWSSGDEGDIVSLLTVSGTQFAIMRWDLSSIAGMKAKGSGLLELTTYHLERSPKYVKDFGMVRIGEIIGGDVKWTRENVTYGTLVRERPLSSVFNSQMIIDIDVRAGRGSKSYATISRPVLQRLIDGKTLGIVIKPLGAVSASFYSMKDQRGRFGAMLHLNVASDSIAVPARTVH